MTGAPWSSAPPVSHTQGTITTPTPRGPKAKDAGKDCPRGVRNGGTNRCYGAQRKLPVGRKVRSGNKSSSEVEECGERRGGDCVEGGQNSGEGAGPERVAGGDCSKDDSLVVGKEGKHMKNTVERQKKRDYSSEDANDSDGLRHDGDKKKISHGAKKRKGTKNTRESKEVSSVLGKEGKRNESSLRGAARKGVVKRRAWGPASCRYDLTGPSRPFLAGSERPVPCLYRSDGCDPAVSSKANSVDRPPRRR